MIAQGMCHFPPGFPPRDLRSGRSAALASPSRNAEEKVSLDCTTRPGSGDSRECCCVRGWGRSFFFKEKRLILTGFEREQ